MSDRVREVLGRLKRQGSARAREDMLKRYGIVAPIGVRGVDERHPATS
jgi:hypothetical protein